MEWHFSPQLRQSRMAFFVDPLRPNTNPKMFSNFVIKEGLFGKFIFVRVFSFCFQKPFKVQTQLRNTTLLGDLVSPMTFYLWIPPILWWGFSFSLPYFCLLPPFFFCIFSSICFSPFYHSSVVRFFLFFFPSFIACRQQNIKFFYF